MTCMDYLRRNLIHLIRAQGGVERDLAPIGGRNQSTVNRFLRGETDSCDYAVVKRWADHFKVSMDDLVSRDIALEGRSPPASQPAVLDPEMMGTALTSLDKVIRGRNLKMETQLGKFAKLLIYAYEVQEDLFPGGVPEDKRARYDQVIDDRLGGGIQDGSFGTLEVVAGGGKKGAGPGQAKGKKAGHG